jgi:hypothetical protein
MRLDMDFFCIRAGTTPKGLPQTDIPTILSCGVTVFSFVVCRSVYMLQEATREGCH